MIERSFSLTKRRQIKCQEETEQAQEVRDKEQVEAWVEVVVAGAVEVVLRQALVDIVFAPTAVKEQPINWGLPVISRNAQNAERP